MANRYGGKIVTNGLKMSVDAATVDPQYAAFTNTNLYGGTIANFLKPNGVQNEETLEFGDDPWGRRSILDRTLNNDTSSNYDGGFAQGYYTGIDHTKKYRFTYWSKVDEVGTNGTLYFGLYGGTTSNGNAGVLRFDNGNNNTNPYFACPTRSNYPQGEWIMHCYFAYPSGTSSGGAVDTDTGWYLMDTKRLPFNSSDGDRVFPNLPNAESTDGPRIDFVSNGFKIKTSAGLFNDSGATYIYMAFAENPFKFSLAR